MQSEAMKIAKIGGAATLTAAIIAGLFQMAAAGSSSPPPTRQAQAGGSGAASPSATGSASPPSASPTPSPAAATTTDDPPTLVTTSQSEAVTPGDQPTQTAVTQTSAPSLVYCSDLVPIGGLGNWEAMESADMGGKTYGNSLIFAPSSFVSARLTMTFNIPAGMRHFRATVGFDDRTLDGAAAFFQIELGQTPVDAGFTLNTGQQKPVDVNITGAQHLTIEVEITERPGGVVNPPLHAMWGDARFSTT